MTDTKQGSNRHQPRATLTSHGSVWSSTYDLQQSELNGHLGAIHFLKKTKK